MDYPRQVSMSQLALNNKSVRWTDIFTIVAILLFFFLAGKASATEGKFIIGLIPELNVFQQTRRYQPLADYLGQHLGLKVELTILSRYGNIIERLREQQVDAAFLGSFTGALAIRQFGVEPLARPVLTDGSSTYTGYIFVRNDSGIDKVADMKGKSIALVEQATTAGYIFPRAYIRREAHVERLDEWFAKLIFTGSHDAAIMAVASGAADVGAAKNTAFEMTKTNKPEIAKDLKILAASPAVPSNGLCVRKEIKAELKKKLLQTLLSMHVIPEGKAVLQQLGATQFISTAVEDYDPVITLAAEAGINVDDYVYTNQ